MNRLAMTALGILLGTSPTGGAFWGIEGHHVVARIAAGSLMRDPARPRGEREIAVQLCFGFHFGRQSKEGLTYFARSN